MNKQTEIPEMIDVEFTQLATAKSVYVTSMDVKELTAFKKLSFEDQAQYLETNADWEEVHCEHHDPQGISKIEVKS